jgi:hypothetical protein
MVFQFSVRTNADHFATECWWDPSNLGSSTLWEAQPGAQRCEKVQCEPKSRTGHQVFRHKECEGASIELTSSGTVLLNITVLAHLPILISSLPGIIRPLREETLEVDEPVLVNGSFYDFMPILEAYLNVRNLARTNCGRANRPVPNYELESGPTVIKMLFGSAG